MKQNLNLAQIFNNNMVLQREVEIPIWGKAQSDSQITVEFCSISRTSEVTNGEWLVKLPPFKAGGPYEMKITDGKDEIILSDILVGEVWIAGGQSNMELLLEDSMEGKDEIPVADFGNIRYFEVPKLPYETAALEFPNKYSDHAEWKLCNPENAGNFSAVAFHFAKNIQKSLDVPIGIIGCNLGGSSASCWMNEKYLLEDMDVKTYFNEYNEIVSTQDPKEYEEKHTKFEVLEVEIKKLLKQVEKGECTIDKVDEVFKGFEVPIGPKFMWRPMGLYYNMIKNIIPYAAKGVIFYQGESDERKPRIYSKLFSKMIGNWREDWNNNEMPFLFVQISSFGCYGNPDGEDWAVLREQQAIVEKIVPNTAMAVSLDYGNEFDIHPKEKKPIGDRLGILARAKIYGENIEYSGPVYKNHRIEGNKVIITFEHLGKGLCVKGENLKGFTICEKTKKFIKAKAEIKGDTVEVYSDDISTPVAVRYGFANYVEVNLYNKDGLPARTFRTDIYS